MFIGITGPLCAGRNTLAQYLIDRYSFQPLRIWEDNNPPNEDPYLLPGTKTFPTAAELLEFVTVNWQNHYVVCNLYDIHELELARKRPFFLLVSIDAPTIVRYQRFIRRECDSSQQIPPLTLEEFVRFSDCEIFGTPLQGYCDRPSSKRSRTPVHSSIVKAGLFIVNHYTDISDFHMALDKLNVTNPERLRPSWDTYFMRLADLAATRSNCMKRAVGCILVKDRRIVATGYNGTPRGVRNCNEGGCQRCNLNARCGHALDTCLCLHAEENALIEAGRSRLDGGESTLYCNTCPCLGCAKKVVQAGVTEVVYSQEYGVDGMTSKLFKEAGVRLRQHQPVESMLQSADPLPLPFQADVVAN